MPAVTNAAGVIIGTAFCKPFGEQSEGLLPGDAAPQIKGRIAEISDADAGLESLNARYDGPEPGKP